MAATICGMVAYMIIHRLEHRVATTTFDGMAETAILRAQQLTSIKIQGANLLASMFSHSFPDTDQWPFVALPNFSETASRIGLMARPIIGDGALTFQQSFAFNPLIRPEQVGAFETFAQQVYRQEGYNDSAGVSPEPEVGFGLFAHHVDNGTRYKAGSGQGSNYLNRYNISAPIFQINKENSPALMFDLHSSANVGPWIESLLDCFHETATATMSEQKHQPSEVDPSDRVYSSFHRERPCMFMTTLHPTMMVNEPTLNFGVPIWPSNNNDTVVGMITSIIHWTEALEGIVPPYFGDIAVVIESVSQEEDINMNSEADYIRNDANCASYIISGGVPRLMGKGDRHEKALDVYAHSVILNDEEDAASASVRYKMTIYPTNQMFDEFYSHVPLAVCLSFVAIIFCCTLVFFIYDGLVKHEARRRNAVIALKRRFVRFVSHEVRNPLNTVFMGLELLQADLQDETQQPEDDESLKSSVPEEEDGSSSDNQKRVSDRLSILHDVMENCQNSVSVLNDILSYDKIEAGTLQLECTPVDIWGVIRTTVNEFQIQAKNRQVPLWLHDNEIRKPEISKDFIPQQQHHEDTGSDVLSNTEYAAEQFCVMGDSSRLSSVIRNLIANALKFTPAGKSITFIMSYKMERESIDSMKDNSEAEHGGIPVKRLWSKFASKNSVSKTNIAFSSTQHHINLPPLHESIVITVKDEGVGMNESQLCLLFGEGVQFDANRLQHGGGSGLGLFISKSTVLRHGGKIYAHSDGPGLGASFVVELPLYKFPLQNQKSRIDDATSKPTGTSCNPRAFQTASSPDTDSASNKGHKSLCHIDDSTRTHSTHPVVLGDESDKYICDNTNRMIGVSLPRHRRILVVEDVISNSKMLVRLLKRVGHIPETAMNGQEAVDMLKGDIAAKEDDIHHQIFDTILMDYEMPIMNGPEATQRIRDLGFRGAIFGVTGNALLEDIAVFRNHGANAVVTKPIQQSKIEECWTKFDKDEIV